MSSNSLFQIKGESMIKTVISAKAILVLAATTLVGTDSMLAQASGEQKTLTGVVSDAMCGQTHMMKDKPAADCLRYCVKQGTKYALVAGKNVYTATAGEQCAVCDSCKGIVCKVLR